MNPDDRPHLGTTDKIQPLLTSEERKPRERTSWKSAGASADRTPAPTPAPTPSPTGPPPHLCILAGLQGNLCGPARLRSTHGCPIFTTQPFEVALKNKLLKRRRDLQGTEKTAKSRACVLHFTEGGEEPGALNSSRPPDPFQLISDPEPGGCSPSSWQPADSQPLRESALNFPSNSPRRLPHSPAASLLPTSKHPSPNKMLIRPRVGGADPGPPSTAPR